MKQYKIPQNVQIEDKIFGNILTLRELLIIGVGFAISYLLFIFFSSIYTNFGIIDYGLMGIPVAIAVAFAFVRLGQVSLFHYSLLFLEFVLRPQRRVWDKKGNIILSLSMTPPPKHKNETEVKELSREEKLAKIKDVSSVLNSGNHL